MVEGEVVRPNSQDAAEVHEEAYDRGYDVIVVDVNVAGQDRTFTILRRNGIFVPYISFLSEAILDLKGLPELPIDFSDVVIEASNDLNKLFIRWGHIQKEDDPELLNYRESDSEILTRLKEKKLLGDYVEAEYSVPTYHTYNETFLTFFRRDNDVMVKARGCDWRNVSNSFDDPSIIVEDVKDSLKAPRIYESPREKMLRDSVAFVSINYYGELQKPY